MLALTAAATAPHLALTEAPDPDPRPDEALIAVKAVSLNRGELRRLPDMEPGTVTGWDLAGVVEAAASDGSGPPAGARVVGLVDRGAWGQRAAVPTGRLAPLPDAVSFTEAATLPVAGMTALVALEIGGLPLGRRVAVTGATGGVGRFAVQLAALSGAHVTALVRSLDQADALGRLGAHDVVTTLDGDYDVIVEGVGGDTLGQALQHVAPDGTVISFASTEAETTFPTRSLFGRAPGARLYGLLLFAELARGPDRGSRLLGRLAVLVAAGRLHGSVEREADWREGPEMAQALLERAVTGKVVLHVS